MSEARKNDGARIFAIVAGALAAFFLVVAGIGAYWWAHQGSAWFAEGKAAFEEGRALGPSGDSPMCLEHSLDRFGGCQGMGCELSVLVFLNACLAEATPSAEFCDGVPAQTALFESVSWRSDRCDAAGYPGDTCEQLFASVQGYCDGLQRGGYTASNG